MFMHLFLLKNMVKVEEKDKCFGITDNGIEVVPFVYYDKKGAIEEWVYFEKLNITERQFLPHIRTMEEIDRIASELNIKNKESFFHLGFNSELINLKNQIGKL